MEFREWFCLRGRNNFTIDPKINPEDARFYFGREEIRHRVISQLRRSFIAPGTTKIMIWGPYGSGKTQTLYYLDWVLKNEPPSSLSLRPHTVHLDVEVRSGSEARAIHVQLLEALGKDTVSEWVRALFKTTADFREALSAMASDPNAAVALENLRAQGDIALTAWRWLTAQGLTSKELENLGVTRSLGQDVSGDMVASLNAIGQLAEANGEKLIFLLDELEGLQNVRSGDTAESIHEYFRRLANTDNRFVGFIVGFMASTLSEGPRILTREDISSRIGMTNYVEIGHLPAVTDVKEFIKELLEHLVDTAKAEERIRAGSLPISVETYPFLDSAFQILADYASQDPYRALPRNIINAINECAIQAWDEDKRLIDEGVVNDVAPLIFS